jgi:DNA-binding SARP family transcriptional activator
MRICGATVAPAGGIRVALAWQEGRPVVAPRVEFCLLGPMVVRCGGVSVPLPRGRQRTLLAVLLLGRGRALTADELAELLWAPGPVPGSAAVTVRTYVKRLRRSLGSAGRDRIVSAPGGYLIRVEPGELDIAVMEQELAAARASGRAAAWDQAAVQAGAALRLWRGEPLADAKLPPLAEQEAARLTEMRLQARELRFEADLALARHTEAVTELPRLIAAHPVRERLYALLMLALYRCGRRAEALEAYRAARDVLAREIGADPGPELQALHQQILRDDPALALPPSLDALASSPGPPRDRVGAGTGVMPAAAGTAGVAARRAPQLPVVPRQLPVVPRQLPAAPRHFAGRRAELARLRGVAGAAGGVVVGVISGMAGVGKTALALHWAHRVAGEFPDGQLYADLGGFGPSGTAVEPAVALDGFLDGLGVAAERIPRSLEARAGLYRSLVAGRRMLVVLDNARDVEQVRLLLPGSPGCVVLVTSRARLTGLAVGGNAELLALDVLSEQEARELLSVRLGGGRVAGEPDAVREVIGLCAGLPLALAVAAARAVAHPGFPLAGLAAELRDAGRRLDGLDAGDAAASVRAVVSWSCRQLAELPARMLRLLSLHPGPGITAAAAASLAGIPLRQARLALAALAEANLVTEYLPGRYGLHDLLRAFAAEQARAAGAAEDHRAAVGRMLDHYLHTVNAAGVMTVWERDPITLAAPAPGVFPERVAAGGPALAWLDAEHAVLVRVIRQAAGAGFDVHAWQLAWSLVVFFRMRGHWHDLVTTQRIALAAARRLRDQDAQARVHWELGLAVAQAGRFGQAHSHLGQALQLYENLGDQDGQARARISLGLVLERQGRDRDALDSTLAALRPPPAGPQPPGKAITRVTQAVALNNSGWYHARLGEFSRARTHCEQALQLFRDIGFRYGQAITLDSLGYICHHHGDHDRAIAHYRLAAGHYRQMGDLYNLAQTLARLGESFQAAGDTAAARHAWQQAIHILDGMQHPDADHTRARLRQLNNSMNGQA